MFEGVLDEGETDLGGRVEVEDGGCEEVGLVAEGGRGGVG